MPATDDGGFINRIILRPSRLKQRIMVLTQYREHQFSETEGPVIMARPEHRHDVTEDYRTIAKNDVVRVLNRLQDRVAHDVRRSKESYQGYLDALEDIAYAFYMTNAPPREPPNSPGERPQPEEYEEEDYWRGASAANDDDIRAWESEE